MISLFWNCFGKKSKPIVTYYVWLVRLTVLKIATQYDFELNIDCEICHWEDACFRTTSLSS